MLKLYLQNARNESLEILSQVSNPYHRYNCYVQGIKSITLRAVCTVGFKIKTVFVYNREFNQNPMKYIHSRLTPENGCRNI